jgi:hypothetical protein
MILTLSGLSKPCFMIFWLGDANSCGLIDGISLAEQVIIALI